eukprot:SAG31_NODE_12491_length_937_cov_2.810263_2_plen_127_part_01
MTRFHLPTIRIGTRWTPVLGGGGREEQQVLIHVPYCEVGRSSALRHMLFCPPLLLLAATAAAAAQSPPPAAPPEPCPTAAAHVVRSTNKLRGGAPVAASLQSVGIGGDRTGATAELLAKHGFQTALD